MTNLQVFTKIGVMQRSQAVMHQHVTHNRAHPTQKLFTKAIMKFFRKIIPEQWHNFRNQVTDNFRIISEQNIRVLKWLEYNSKIRYLKTYITA